MTVFAKDTTYGLETKVKDFQEYLNIKLPELWSGELEIYGICYPLIRTLDGTDITIPEAYTGKGKKKSEYSEVFVNDNIAATVGFIVEEKTVLPTSANINIIFTVQLPKIYPNEEYRQQEKSVLEARKVVQRFFAIGEVLEINEGVEDVFTGFDTERIKHRDMHPWHVFSLNIDLPYFDNSCL